MPNNKIDKIAHTRLDNHEKLCRIMQRQTHERLRELSRQIERLEKENRDLRKNQMLRNVKNGKKRRMKVGQIY